MTAEEYFRNHWQQANKERFGDYGDYDSDEYAIAFAEEYARFKALLKDYSICIECQEPFHNPMKERFGQTKCGFCSQKMY